MSSFYFPYFGGSNDPYQGFQSQFVKSMIRVSHLHDVPVQEKHMVTMWLKCGSDASLNNSIRTGDWTGPSCPRAVIWGRLGCWPGSWGLARRCWWPAEGAGASRGVRTGLTLDLSLGCQANSSLSRSHDAGGNTPLCCVWEAKRFRSSGHQEVLLSHQDLGIFHVSGPNKNLCLFVCLFTFNFGNCIAVFTIAGPKIPFLVLDLIEMSEDRSISPSFADGETEVQMLGGF